MKLEQERLNDFQSRMNEWVSKQGLLFQLRYAGNVKGAKSTFFHTLGQLFLRLLLLLVIVALGFWWYLVKRVETKGFRSGLQAEIAQNLGAEELELRGVSRKRGMLKLGAINMIGGETSAFEDLEARGIQTLMGVTDGLLTPWSGDSLEIERMSAFVKGGASSDESAAEAYKSLFWDSENLKIRSIRVAEANFKWGYSKSNQGQIIGSKMIATRKGGGWILLFKGGTFSQNWFRNLSLERMEVEITPEGFYIHEARLKKGEGEISFTLKKVSGGEAPVFDGAGSIVGVAMRDLTNLDFREIINGSLSAKFEVSGSTNTQSGFKYVVDATLDEKNRIELEDNISLLRAISTADYLRSYRKVRFTEGGFRFTTVPGKVEVENIALVASRLMRLEGAFSVRPPRTEDLPEGFTAAEQANLTDFIAEEESGNEMAFEFSLRKAGEEVNSSEKDKDGKSVLFNESKGANTTQELAVDARARALQRVFLDGGVRVGILASSFERSPKLSAEYPVDEATDLRWIDLIWNGESPFEIGEELSKKIFSLHGSDR